MHPLAGPRVRLLHCWDLLQQEINGFRMNVRYEVEVGSLDDSGEYHSLLVRPSSEPPLQWSVLIGDIAHNLRSSLDGLVWQLVLWNGQQPGGMRSLAFPVYRTPESYAQRGAGTIHGRVRQVHEALIESLQPFNTEGGATTSTLLMISELNNADKHRLIQIGAYRAGNVGRRVEIRGYLYRNRPPTGLTFKEVNDLTEFQQGAFLVDGGVFGKVHRSVIERWPDISYMPVTSDFVFSEGCDAVKGLPVLDLLGAMIRHCEHIVARRFSRRLIHTRRNGADQPSPGRLVRPLTCSNVRPGCCQRCCQAGARIAHPR